MSDGAAAAIFVLVSGGIVYWVVRFFDFSHPEFWGLLAVSAFLAFIIIENSR